MQKTTALKSHPKTDLLPIIPLNNPAELFSRKLPLWQIFAQAQQTLDKDFAQFKIADQSLSAKQLSLIQRSLILLQNTGTEKYKEFCLKTNTRFFSFTQRFISYIPLKISKVIQHLYPFSLLYSRIEEAILTKKHFHRYNNTLNQLINVCKELVLPHKNELKDSITQPSLFVHPKAISSSLDLHPSHKETIAFPPLSDSLKIPKNQLSLESTPLPETDESEKLFSQISKIELTLESLNHVLSAKIISPFKQFNSIKRLLSELQTHIDQLDAVVDKKEILNNLNMNSALIEALVPKSPSQWCDFAKIQPNDPLLGQLLIDLVDKNFVENLINPLLAEPIMLSRNAYSLQLSRNGTRLRLTDLKNYSGPIRADFTDRENLLDTLKDLQSTLNKENDCQPITLIIPLEEKTELDADLIEAIYELRTRIPHIQLEGLKHLNLLALPLDTRTHFFELLPQFEMIASISLCELHLPTGESCLTAQELRVLGESLSATHLDLNLSQFPTRELESILNHFAIVGGLTLSHSDITDRQFLQLMKNKRLDKLCKLDVGDCSQLTTDLLIQWMTLPELANLNCPNLRQGTLKLPYLSNPFDVKLFYNASKVTQSQANQFYNGPEVLAPIFQIPLARSKEANVFSDNQTILDPQSVNLWLYRNDLTHLNPQEFVQAIYADNSALVNDAHLLQFVQKFPNVSTISLYNCPGITNQGIHAMLLADSQLKTLDLTCCSAITDELFASESENKNQCFNQLEEIIVSGTQMTNTAIDQLPEMLRKKIRWERKSLAISTENVSEHGSLKQALEQYQPLNGLKQLDLSGCLLTRQNITELLELMNVGIDDPQRLNISELILPARMPADWLGDKIQLLGNLNQVVINNPKTVNQWQNTFPSIKFQTQFIPLNESIDSDACLTACMEHENASLKNKEEKRKNEQNYLFNRAVVELFSETCVNQENALNVVSKKVKNVDQPEFYNLPLTFLSNESSTTLNLFKTQIYCQSGFMRENMRAGGLFFKTPPTLLNQNATPQAAEVLERLIKGQPLKKEVSFNALFEAAELTNSKNLDISEHYEKLIHLIYEKYQQLTHKNLDRDTLDTIALKAIQLQDENGMELLGTRLLNLSIRHPAFASTIRNSFAANLPLLNFAYSLMDHLATLNAQLAGHKSPIINTLSKELVDYYVTEAKLNASSLIKEINESSLSLFEQQTLIKQLLHRLSEDTISQHAESKLSQK